jgi:hypothetical protein
LKISWKITSLLMKNRTKMEAMTNPRTVKKAELIRFQLRIQDMMGVPYRPIPGIQANVAMPSTGKSFVAMKCRRKSTTNDRERRLPTTPKKFPVRG